LAGGGPHSNGFSNISAHTATITLSDTSAQNFGTFANPISTGVRDLSVSTQGGGSQFIDETGSFTAPNLSAGAGDVMLTTNGGIDSGGGSVADGDGDPDITAAAATVTLKATAAEDFGSLTNPIGTGVTDLTVNTSA